MSKKRFLVEKFKNYASDLRASNTEKQSLKNMLKGQIIDIAQENKWEKDANALSWFSLL